MSNIENTPENRPEMKLFHVLMMGVVNVTVQAESSDAAILTAVRQAPAMLDPQEIRWVPSKVSDRPFVIANPDEDESHVEMLSPAAPPLIHKV